MGRAWLKFNNRESNTPTYKWAKDLCRSLPKEGSQTHLSVWQDAPPHLSSETWFKPQWHIAAELRMTRCFMTSERRESGNRGREPDISKHWWGCRAVGTLIHSWRECKAVQPVWKIVWRFLNNLNMTSPYYSAIALLYIYPNELKLMSSSEPAHRYLEVINVYGYLFIFAQTWKQSGYSLVGEWINQL